MATREGYPFWKSTKCDANVRRENLKLMWPLVTVF